MSGKYVKRNEKNRGLRMPLIVIACMALLCAAVVWLLQEVPADPAGTGAATTVSGGPAAAGSTGGETGTAPLRVEVLDEAAIDLGHGLWVTDVGKYTGVYMEDGSDEIVSGVLMIAVKNTGADTIQYAEITMPVGDKTASFALTTLPPGGTVILLESSRMAYTAGTYTTAAASNVALFQQPLSLCEDRLEIQILDGAINITNVSGGDIAGDIVIYYKNSAADVFYGGITYRVRIEGGLKADEVRQIVASHFSASGSTIMFVTCGDA